MSGISRCHRQERSGWYRACRGRHGFKCKLARLNVLCMLCVMCMLILCAPLVDGDDGLTIYTYTAHF